MTAYRQDWDFRNNVDCAQGFTLYAAPGGTPPWANVAPWAADTAYEAAPASLVANGGNLYVASASAGSWTSAASFSADAANWIEIASGAAYGASPLDLTGKQLFMRIAGLAADRLGIAKPLQNILALSTDASSGNPGTLQIAANPATGAFGLGLAGGAGARRPGRGLRLRSRRDRRRGSRARPLGPRHRLSGRVLALSASSRPSLCSSSPVDPAGFPRLEKRNVR